MLVSKKSGKGKIGRLSNAVLLCCFGAVVGLLIVFIERTNREAVAKSIAKEENWRGAPVGSGEDTVDSYHSYDHRPPSNKDPRDAVLSQYEIHPCPNGGIGRLISGKDSRYDRERNPKFVCDVESIPRPHRRPPCVVYSFGSFDEISFEVGMDKWTHSKCDVHTFDPFKLTPQEHADKYHFTVHDVGISDSDYDDGKKYKTLSTIMKELGHSRIDVFKLDVEGHEKEVLPNVRDAGLLDKMDQAAIEFHSVELLREGLDIMHSARFGIVYARREDRCEPCTEVAFVKL